MVDMTAVIRKASGALECRLADMPAVIIEESFVLEDTVVDVSKLEGALERRLVDMPAVISEEAGALEGTLVDMTAVIPKASDARYMIIFYGLKLTSEMF